MSQLLYGVAYYDEYMPSNRLNQDIELMQAAGINVVRIAESTWSTHEPQPSRRIRQVSAPASHRVSCLAGCDYQRI